MDPRDLNGPAGNGTSRAYSRAVSLRQLPARGVPLGGTRAMLVRRTLPHRELPTIGAWCFVDDYGPAPAQMDLPPHPHIGLQTVTWLLSGEVRHRDSLGSDQLIRPGTLNLMTAGHGMAHAETSTPGSDVLRGVQPWVALPYDARDTARAFEHQPGLPEWDPGGAAAAVRATVLLGRLDQVESPARAYTPIVGAELVVDGPGTLPLTPAWEHGVLALGPGLVVDGEPLEASALAYLAPGRDAVTVAGQGRALLLGGEPFGPQLLMWWNFVGRTHEEVEQARSDWEAQAGLPETETAAARYGLVPGHGPDAGPEAGRIPAPPLPGVRLTPRKRL